MVKAVEKEKGANPLHPDRGTAKRLLRNAPGRARQARARHLVLRENSQFSV